MNECRRLKAHLRQVRGNRLVDAAVEATEEVATAAARVVDEEHTQALSQAGHG